MRTLMAAALGTACAAASAVPPGPQIVARSGPGADYAIIARLARHAPKRQRLTCVPLGGLPRWCLLAGAAGRALGWVPVRGAQQDRTTAPGISPRAAEATALVRRLYQRFAQVRASGNPADNPFAAAQARQFFFADLVPELAGHGADLLYQAQDFQGRITAIAPDPEQPEFRGMVSIRVDFRNYGQPGHATYRLRADPAQPGAPLRIFRIDTPQGAFPPLD